MQWDVCRRAMLGFLERYDVILSRSIHIPPSHTALRCVMTCLQRVSRAIPSPIVWQAGLPLLSVQDRQADGLPIGVQVVVGPWREDIALGIAGCIELALGGWQRPLLGGK